MKNEYAHFNPTKYDLDVKIATVKDRFSLQVQHQLPYNLDSKVSEKSLNWEGGICA